MAARARLAAAKLLEDAKREFGLAAAAGSEEAAAIIKEYEEEYAAAMADDVTPISEPQWVPIPREIAALDWLAANLQLQTKMYTAGIGGNKRHATRAKIALRILRERMPYFPPRAAPDRPWFPPSKDGVPSAYKLAQDVMMQKIDNLEVGEPVVVSDYGATTYIENWAKTSTPRFYSVARDGTITRLEKVLVAGDAPTVEPAGLEDTNVPVPLAELADRLLSLAEELASAWCLDGFADDIESIAERVRDRDELNKRMHTLDERMAKRPEGWHPNQDMLMLQLRRDRRYIEDMKNILRGGGTKYRGQRIWGKDDDVFIFRFTRQEITAELGNDLPNQLGHEQP